MGFKTINIHCNVKSVVKDNGNNAGILQTFNLIEQPGFMINILPKNILYQYVKKERIEYKGFHIRDEHGSPIVFNGNVLSFSKHLI